MNPRVTGVVPNNDYTLTLTFADAKVRSFDVKPYLGRGSFTELRDLSVFKMVQVSMGTVCWHGGQDFCPDTLYEESLSVAS
jgi:hypothetical protein